MKERFGWKFPDADQFMVSQITPAGDYQRANLDAALAYVTDWSIAVDGGAHAGTWTRLMSQRFTRVLAFEPSSDTREALTANMEAFGCANVEIHAVALGSSAGVVSMRLDRKGESMKNTGARFVQDGGSIPRITLDSLDLPTLGFLKLDIEGAEVDALLGARQTLARCRPVVLFEDKGLWSRFGHRRDAPQHLLTAAGYALRQRVSCDEIWTAV
jgi:FkbM family methyltransferase